MKSSVAKVAAAAVALFVPLLAAATALPSVIISEVSAVGSASTYNADWFELTNTGSSALDITGWKMDDNSNSFAASVALRGVTSIAAGQSVVFLEGTSAGASDATLDSNFKTAWFGTAATSVIFGNYGGAQVGLSAISDAVNIFDSFGTVVTRVDFGASTAATSFDNSAGLNNVMLTQKSVVGVNGAFMSANSGEVGSPGFAVAPVPEPEIYALTLAGLALVGVAARRRKNAA
ncbi:MAG: lamin tail domain-containing protein [Bacteriovorax sp.]|nr:lamin tail domain-containing protein [Rhizobacter sp.]